MRPRAHARTWISPSRTLARYVIQHEERITISVRAGHEPAGIIGTTKRSSDGHQDCLLRGLKLQAQGRESRGRNQRSHRGRPSARTWQRRCIRCLCRWEADLLEAAARQIPRQRRDHPAALGAALALIHDPPRPPRVTTVVCSPSEMHHAQAHALSSVVARTASLPTTHDALLPRGRSESTVAYERASNSVLIPATSQHDCSAASAAFELGGSPQ